MGRGKFGPQHGPWIDAGWQGWWGENPPFHTPVYVLTHHHRPSLGEAGGTTFHFLDASPVEALQVAQRGRPWHCAAEPLNRLGIIAENRSILASVGDPDGRAVVLTATAWVHILQGHPELTTWQALLIEAVGFPDYRAPDPIKGRYRYWLKDQGPSGWLRVVVDFSVRPAEIVTAFPERKDPAGWQP